MNIIKQVARHLIGSAVLSFSLLSLLYIGLILLLPANPKTMQAYDLSTIEYRIIILALVVPSIIVWFVAFMGYSRLRRFAQLVRRTPEGPHFRQLANGATWLAWSLPVPVIVAFTVNVIARQVPEFQTAAIIIINYLNVLLPLIAFTIIGSASRGLVNDAKLRFSLSSVRFIMAGFAVAGVLYCYLIFRHFDLSSLTSANNPYHLPIWVMVLTVIIPYLYAWFIGILSAYEIQLFSKNVRGVLYRRALRLLAIGLILVIAGSIALQYTSGVYPRAGYLVFDYRLVLSFVFRIIEGIGFATLMVGANRLRKIEEV